MVMAQSDDRNQCGICRLHDDASALAPAVIWEDSHWLLRHHPLPAPLVGWCLLDAKRHLGGPIDFTDLEAGAWGRVVQRASSLEKQVSGCDRVYAIAFGEGARHLHLHLIPRHLDDPSSKAWAVADLYRAMDSGDRAAANPSVVASLVDRCRSLISAQG